MASQRSLQSATLLQNAILITYEINGNTHRRQEDMATALVNASSLGYLDIVKTLVDEGADINTLDRGSTPLTVASKNGEYEVVQYLCDQRARVDQCDSRGLSALAYAVMHGFTDIVELLCYYGADANGQGRCVGTTILHDAVISGDLKIVETLIKVNASVDDKYLYKLTPKQLAKTLNHFTIANLLREVKADRSSHSGNKSDLFARFRKKVLKKEDTEEARHWQEKKRDIFQRLPYTLPLDDIGTNVGQSNKSGFSSTTFESLSVADQGSQTTQGLMYCDPDIKRNKMEDQTNGFRKPQCKRSESSRSWVKPPSALKVTARRFSGQQLQHWESQEHVVVQIWRSGSTGNSRPDLPFPNASEGCIPVSSRQRLGLTRVPSRPSSLVGPIAETNVSTDNRSTGKNKYIFKNAKFYIDQPELKSMNIDNAGNVAVNNSTINQSGSSYGEQIDSSDDDSSDDKQCET